jgi:RNA polymerase sigma factor (sigma-70 family)
MDSSARIEAWLDDQKSSPEERAQRAEQLVELTEALAELPEAQQEAVVFHHLHGMSIDETSRLMDRTPAAVGGLLKRGLHTLRSRFEGGA